MEKCLRPLRSDQLQGQTPMSGLAIILPTQPQGVAPHSGGLPDGERCQIVEFQYGPGKSSTKDSAG